MAIAVVEIDGGEGSGSGTIVRLAVALCTITGQDLRLANIRGRRDRPGLRRQHQQVVAACARLCQARVEGVEVGSNEITFRPGRTISGGSYEWDLGTAGSTTMLAISLLLAGSFADRPSLFTFKGGLFQDFAPSAYHLQRVLLPVLRKIGVSGEVFVRRPGYVPEGQGVLELRCTPPRTGFAPLVLREQGRVKEVKGVALSSHLAEQEVSDRMAEECAARLAEAGHEADIEVIYESSASQKGADLTVWAETDSGAVIGADMAGRLGRRSEDIGRHVARSLLEDLKTGATVDRYAADQLVPFCALARGRSEYLVPAITEHLETNLRLVETLLGARFEIEGKHVGIEGVDWSRTTGPA